MKNAMNAMHTNAHMAVKTITGSGAPKSTKPKVVIKNNVGTIANVNADQKAQLRRSPAVKMKPIT